MDSEGQFWVRVWAIAATAFIMLILTLAVATYLFNQKEYKVQQECIQAGGQFVVINGYTQCLKK